MHKVSLIWSSFGLLLLIGCGGKGASGSDPTHELRDAGREDAGEHMRSDAMTQMPPTPGPGDEDAGGPVSCTPQGYRSECPERPCEVLEGCDDGTCKYVAFICGRGSGCPREKCVATERNGGGYDNRCVLVPNDGCAEGESCRNDQCLPIEQGLNLWNAGFSSEGAAQGAAPSGSGLRLSGQIGDLRPGQGFVGGASGTLRLSGGLVSHGVRAAGEDAE